MPEIWVASPYFFGGDEFLVPSVPWFYMQDPTPDSKWDVKEKPGVKLWNPF